MVTGINFLNGLPDRAHHFLLTILQEALHSKNLAFNIAMVVEGNYAPACFSYFVWRWMTNERALPARTSYILYT